RATLSSSASASPSSQSSSSGSWNDGARAVRRAARRRLSSSEAAWTWCRCVGSVGEAGVGSAGAEGAGGTGADGVPALSEKLSSRSRNSPIAHLLENSSSTPLHGVKGGVPAGADKCRDEQMPCLHCIDPQEEFDAP